MLTLNLESNRDLREGDRVRMKHGEQRGRYAQVVGFDLREADTPVVIQHPTTAGGQRELVGANDIEYEGCFQEAPDTLEPLPDIPTVLTEDRGSYWTCGRILCMKLTEDGSTISFVPKDDGIHLTEIFDRANNVQEAVEAMLEVAFITRRPHLVQIGNTKRIWQLLGSVSPGEALIHLTA